MATPLEELEPDRIENCLHPRETHVLYGHEDAEQAFVSSIRSQQLHHAWMLEGPKGCGKATLAYRVARTLLGAEADRANGLLGTSENHPVSRQIAAASYPDLMAITNGWNEKTKKWRTEISVNQIRKINGMFANRAAGNGWRVCIIDCADDLNHNAANALLKILEEPPERGMLMLICNRPGRMLATIRSRCRKLVLRAPGLEIAHQIALQSGASEKDAKLAAQLAKGNPGRAAEIINADGLALWAWIDQIFSRFPRLDKAALHQMANRLAAKNARQSLMLFLDLLQIRLHREVLQHSKTGHIEDLSPLLHVIETNQMLQIDLNRINLDAAMVVDQLVTHIAKASRQMQNDPANVS